MVQIARYARRKEEKLLVFHHKLSREYYIYPHWQMPLEIVQEGISEEIKGVVVRRTLNAMGSIVRGGIYDAPLPCR